MGTRYVVDESKAKGYLAVVVVCPDDQVRDLRRAVVGLVLPGQRSLHMKAESDRRRRIITAAIGGLPIETWIVDASSGHGTEHERRGRVIEVIAAEAGSRAHLVFDRDATMERFDRRTLSAMPADRRPTHVHLARHEEPLLALPDVIAWCWARGGGWRERVEQLTPRLMDA